MVNLGTIDRRRKDRGSVAMASNSIGPERHHLARQVQAFRGHAKRLKRIFKDTVKVLSDLQDFDESLSIDQILAVDAQKCISNVVSGRTALVVFGDTRLRASVVNEILGEWENGGGRVKEGGRGCKVSLGRKIEKEKVRKRIQICGATQNSSQLLSGFHCSLNVCIHLIKMTAAPLVEEYHCVAVCALGLWSVVCTSVCVARLFVAREREGEREAQIREGVMQSQRSRVHVHVCTHTSTCIFTCTCRICFLILCRTLHVNVYVRE